LKVESRLSLLASRNYNNEDSRDTHLHWKKIGEVYRSSIQGCGYVFNPLPAAIIENLNFGFFLTCSQTNQ